MNWGFFGKNVKLLIRVRLDSHNKLRNDEVGVCFLVVIGIDYISPRLLRFPLNQRLLIMKIPRETHIF